MYRAIMPDWWTEIDDIVRYDLATYVTNIFLETETAVAVLRAVKHTLDPDGVLNPGILLAREGGDAASAPDSE